MSTTYLGILNSTPYSVNDSNLTASEPTDVYQFEIADTSSINLSLNEISLGDDADLSLYQDSNGNGSFDDGVDQYITGSLRGGNADDMINTQAGAGTYFAVVNRYSWGSSGDVTYDLDLSATPLYPLPSGNPAPNLLPAEFSGTLSPGTTYTNSDWVGSSDTSDVYSFRVAASTYFNINLTGLSSDADIRLIQDSNNNHIVDSGEAQFYSYSGGNSNESISNLFLHTGGTFYVQVYQYSGDTSYQLTVDAFV